MSVLIGVDKGVLLGVDKEYVFITEQKYCCGTWDGNI